MFERQVLPKVKTGRKSDRFTMVGRSLHFSKKTFSALSLKTWNHFDSLEKANYLDLHSSR